MRSGNARSGPLPSSCVCRQHRLPPYLKPDADTFQKELFYKSEDVVARVKELTDGKGVDTIIDMDFSTTVQWMTQGILRPHGHLVCYGSNPPMDVLVNFRAMLFNSFTLSFFLVYDLPQEQRAPSVYTLNAMLKNKHLIHSIGAEFSLDQVVQAHETVEAGKTIGNVVINIAH